MVATFLRDLPDWSKSGSPEQASVRRLLPQGQRFTSPGRRALRIAGTLLVVMCVMGARRASAQYPTVTVSNPINGAQTSNPSQSISIQVCANHPLSSGTIYLNGVALSTSQSYPGYCYGRPNSAGYVAYGNPVPGTNNIMGSSCDSWGQCSQANTTFTYIPPKNPIIDTLSHNGYDRDVAKCANDCMDAVLSYTTVPYFSLDAPRALTLVYRNQQARPWATIAVDAKDTLTTKTATQMSIMIYHGGASQWLTNSLKEVRYTAAPRGTYQRLGGQFDAGASIATNAYDDSVTIRSYYSDGTSSATTVPTRLLIVNELSSPFGAGWSMAGLQRLYTAPNNSAVVTDGSGSIAYFKGPCPGNCLYTRPVGDVSTLDFHSTASDGSSYYRKYPDGTTVAFRADGREIFVKDRFGNKTSYGYDGSNRLASITDPIGQNITVSYYAGGYLIIDAMGRTTAVTLNGSNDLVSIQDPANGYPIQSAMYDGNHQLLSWNDRRGGAWNIGYDCLHRPTSKTMPSVTVQANGSLQATRPQMRSAAAISHVALCTTSNQGSSGSPAAVVLTSAVRDSIYSARGNATAFQPDPFGAPLKIEQPLNRVTTITRDSASRLTSSVSPSGHTVSYSYTGIDLTSTYDNTTGRYITMTYEPTYHQLVTWTGDVDSFHNFWNGAGELDSSRVNTDPATRYSSYDAFGRPTTITDPAGHTISYTYGPSGTLRNTTIVTAAARTLTRIYDYYGRDSVTIASDNGRNTTLYDYIGRDTLHVGPIADTTITRYDALYITSIRDPLGDWHNFSTNSLGWHDSETDPTGHAESFRYDSTGNVVGYFNRRGQYIALAYDALDQVQSRTADGQTTTFALDPNLRFSVVRAAASYDSIAFDVAGRPVTEVSRHAGQTDSLSSSFDSHNLRQTLSISSPWNASIAYHYNAKLQLDTLTDVANGKAAIGVNADGLPTSLTLPNGLGITSDFPATHTPSSYIYNNPTINTQLGEDLAYSTRSQLSKRVWTGQSNSTTEVGREYSYDLRSRLSQYNRYTITGIENGCDGHRIDDNGNSCVYAGDTSRTAINTLFYDGNGNRSDSGAVRLTGNRLARFAGDTMLYDLDGNLVKRWTLAGGRTDSLVWNSLGQLVTFIHNGAATNFTYDGFGRRIQKASSSGTSNYIWDGDELFAELDGSGARVAEYTYFPGIDNPMSVRRWSGGAATMYYYLLDYPGNVIGLLDGSQQLIKSYTYRPSGVVEDSTSTSSVINTLKFDAREFDSETGLYYTRARYYDPSLGRFISEDPAGLVAGLNPYLYASNDPVNLADPDGLDGCGKALEEEGYTTVNLGTHDWCIPPATLPPVIVTPQSPFDPPQAPVPIPIPYSPFNPTPGPGGPAPAPASPTPPAPKTAKQFLACTASGTAQNFQDFNSAVGRGGRWLIKSAIGAGIAKGLGVPRVGGVLYRGLGVMGDVAPEAYWGELTVSLSATVESWGITYAGADALAAGLVGSAGTGLLAAGAYFGAVGLGSLAVALWRCS